MYPDKYIEFLVHFHGDRDYFECHEILEEYWKKIDPNNKKSAWVGLILMAVSFYHHRRENMNGAERTLRKGICILEDRAGEIKALGLDTDQLIEALKDRLVLIQKGGKYFSINLPIIDPLLKEKCIEVCAAKGLFWCSDSFAPDEDIVHRHKRRDRTIVINERLDALNHKKRQE
ncbi:MULTISPECIES: DUF309 domain-containing protein [unclassified Cytobacillus]|uniref:DUF309 domain-containing protein n=1 Tax=unclassified Cytobacillus TaxID=2675268 RepID=UPI00203EFA14|nr:DUF309 domain-containing protein [Cytobacillus sp. AMY 15.2]MCM3093097.1 DUF309 domain-containing protein [Cytobacillus sp. AMY 15.2]